MFRIIFLIILFLNISYDAWSTFGISTDNRAVDFGQMKLEEKKELAYLGGYHNEITCTSSNQNIWYLKVHLLKPLSSGANTIPLSCFKWQLFWTDGKGTITNSYRFRDFSVSPELTYISGPGDSSGTAIHLRFKYYLKIPEAQAQGIYNTVIRFTLTEIL
jgi:hypothetical protein